MENGQYSSNVTTEQTQQNGSGDALQTAILSAEIPGRDIDRKLFVGGLNSETTDKELREHFGHYGEIESIKVKIDPNTGRSKGFAFIVFNSTEALNKVLAAGDHIINGKKVDPKKAKTRFGKIFVGGLSTDLTNEEIKSYFAQFGTIIEVQIPFDKIKNQRKGFCFITFESEQIVNDLLKRPKLIIKGKMVDIRKATPKLDQMGGPMMGGRGGRGGNGFQNFNQGYGNYSGFGEGYGYEGGYNQEYDYYGSGGSGYSNRGIYGGSGVYQGQPARGRRGGGGQWQQRHQPY